jgi:hypothetical protein|tara:strand:- start:692 stop:916 length:225 start_codon:yes stop_codon:yes gene_type:complete
MNYYHLRRANDDSNPEITTDNPKTAPSARLRSLIIGYDKVVYENILAKDISLRKMREKSFRFDECINKLERIKL